MKLVELEPQEFRKFEQKTTVGNFFQSAERAELRQKMGWQVYLLGVKDGKELKAASLVMERRGLALVQLGPVLDYEEQKVVRFWVKNVVAWARKHQLTTLEVFPPYKIAERDVKGEILTENDDAWLRQIFAEQKFKYLGRTIELENKANRWMAVKELDGLKDMTAVRATYKKNVRNKLRKVSPELEVYELKNKSEIPLLAQAVDESNHKNDVVSRNINYYEWMWDAWPDARFVVARKKDDKAIVAGRILIYHPNEVVSFISGTTQKYKKLNGMTFLQDWLLEDCLKRGVRRANFYGIDGDFSTQNKLLEFKSGFGVKIEEYTGGFRLVLRPMKYGLRQIDASVRNIARKILRR